jgi:Uma2 family endonuclease
MPPYPEDMYKRSEIKLKAGLRVTDEEFWKFCALNSDLRFERTSRGEIVLVPPVGFEYAYRNGLVAAELGRWAHKGSGGVGFGMTEFIFPNGAARSPDAAWVSKTRLAKLSTAQRRKFPPLCPEFIVEVTPSDRLKDAKKKMVEWIANGVQLGWLIDGDRQTAYIYRAGHADPEKKAGIKKIAGEGPIAGFVLDLTQIWAGL